jgi:hypothetical protein
MSGREPKQATANSSANKETAKMNVPSNAPNRLRGLGLSGALALCFVLLFAAGAATPARAEFGLRIFDGTFTNEDGSAATQAGSHPFAATTRVEANYSQVGEIEGSELVYAPDGEFKDLIIEQIDGFTGDTTVIQRCSAADFASGGGRTACPNDAAVGITRVNLAEPLVNWYQSAVYNLQPPPGVPVRIGFSVAIGVRVIVDIGLKSSPDYNVIAPSRNIPQILRFFGARLQLWGVPADPAHDLFRGTCGHRFAGFSAEFTPAFEGCPASDPERPFLTLPRSCTGPEPTAWEADSWQNPGKWISGSILSHDTAVPPNPQGFTGCGKLGFSPRIESRATTDSAETGSGLDFNLDFNDEGLASRDGLAQSEAKRAEVTLPQGVTINPAIGEGLGVCTPSDLERETLASAPGEGCPNASKVGSLHVDSPLVEEGIDGSIFLAQQDDPSTATPGAENPFDSLIALYFVLKNPNLGVLLKLPVLVEPDPKTGQLVVSLDDIPQIPFNHFNAHMREGQRAALVTPATCGTYTTETVLTPWANPSEPLTVGSSFEITKGLGGGPCPPGGVPSFRPSFEAGAINNNAGSFSPFNMRLIRSDGEQDMTKFSATLPPGELGSLAGVSKCPDSAIDVARAKTGRQELAAPSCPANSLIGHTLAGAGVGGALTYVKGQIYLGGPYNGDPLSVIAITPALAGPFDAGTVVVRLALNLNPKTAEVEVDGANSDPIPHILKGIVLKVRDLRVYVDRPNFTLNPTSCDPSSVKATLFGSYLDIFNPADDVPVGLLSRYQAANCLNLGFKPKLALNLKGGTKRGGHPGLVANYQPRPGDANVEGLVVRLPRSAFLDQAHIKTICTRVQFAADACPKNAQYGYIKAWTPLLDEPLQGPVYLRSSNHKLPDLVFDLHGLVDVEVATRIDSAKGGIRATVEDAPDAPLTKVLLRMQGGKKGLIVNSRNLCGHKSKANVLFSGHNGKQFDANPVMRADCGGKRKATP